MRHHGTVSATHRGEGNGLTLPPSELSEGLAHAIVEQSRDFICAFHDEGTIIYANAMAEELLGWPPDEMIGENVTSFVHPDDLARAFLAMGVAVQHRPRLAPAAFRIRHADGRWMRVEVNGNALVSPFSDVIAITCRVSHDADLYSAVLRMV